MDIKLIRPDLTHKDMALEYRIEHFDNGESIINGSELLDKTDSYEEWLRLVNNNSNIQTVNADWVLSDTFLAIDNISYRIIGIIDLRHTLNESLADFGNCGFSVRPSERKKGYATEMLRQVIIIAKDAELKEIHLSVNHNNIFSIKAIIKNGGKLVRSFEHDGEQVDSYKIEL